MVSEKYEVFHINIERGNALDKQVFDYWRNLLNGHATMISSNNIQNINSLITAIISIALGNSANKVLKSIDQDVAEKLAESVALIDTQKQYDNVITF